MPDSLSPTIRLAFSPRRRCARCACSRRSCFVLNTRLETLERSDGPRVRTRQHAWVEHSVLSASATHEGDTWSGGIRFYLRYQLRQNYNFSVNRWVTWQVIEQAWWDNAGYWTKSVCTITDNWRRSTLSR